MARFDVLALVLFCIGLCLVDQGDEGRTARMEVLELCDPEGKGTVRVSSSNGQLVFSSDTWGAATRIGLGSYAGRTGLEISDGGKHTVFVGISGPSGAPIVELRESADWRATFDIKANRGPGIGLFGKEDRPRVYLGTQPDDSAKLALFASSGKMGVLGSASDSSAANGVAVMRHGTESIGAQMTCTDEGQCSFIAFDDDAQVAARIESDASGRAVLRFGNKAGENGVEIRGGSDDAAYVKLFSSKGSPLGGLVPSDDGLAMVLFNNAGVPVFIAPDRK